MFDLASVMQLWDTADAFGRIVLVLMILHPIASAITAATPTPTDDKWYGVIYNKVIRPLALNVFKATEGKK